MLYSREKSIHHTYAHYQIIINTRLLYEHQGADVFGKRRRLENFELGKGDQSWLFVSR
jgi:hypothetical protein